jgi:hypothetical protein
MVARLDATIGTYTTEGREMTCIALWGLTMAVMGVFALLLSLEARLNDKDAQSIQAWGESQKRLKSALERR